MILNEILITIISTKPNIQPNIFLRDNEHSPKDEINLNLILNNITK